MSSIIKVDTIQDQDGNNIINENADVITVGASGDTITIPAGATLANAGTVTGIPASAIDSGTIATARLGTGTASSSTFLRGDQTYAAAGLNGWSEDGANNNLLPASASAGIYLGVNSATASNLLDDYEEGSWTPLLSMGGGSVGYGLNAGAYTKIGRYVFATFAFQLNSVSSPSGAAGITGLPFSGDGSGEEFVNGVYFALVRNLNNSYDNMRGYVMKGTSSISVQVNNTNQNIATLDASNFTSSTLIYGSIGYQTA